MTELLGSFIVLLLIGGGYAFVGYLLSVAAWAVIAVWSNKIARPEWRSMRWALGFVAVLLVAASAAAAPVVDAAIYNGGFQYGALILATGLLVGIIGTIGGASLCRNMR